MIDHRLAAHDLPGLGRLVVAHWQGTLTVWSFTRPGPLPDTVRDALTDLLERIVSRGPWAGSDPPRRGT